MLRNIKDKICNIRKTFHWFILNQMLTNHRCQWFCICFFWNSLRDVLCGLPRGYRLTWPWNQWTLYSKSFSQCLNLIPRVLSLEVERGPWERGCQGLKSETNDCYAEQKSCSTDKLISGRTTQVRHFKHRSYIQLYPVTNEMNYALNADKSVQR